MPYPTKLTPDTIIQQAWSQIDRDGVEAFSLHKLAAHFNVKTPSLYRYINKVELLRAVNVETSRRLFAELYPLLNTDQSPVERAQHVAEVYRAFAHRHPHTYSLLFTNVIDDLRPDDAEQEQNVIPLEGLMADIVATHDVLPALRGLLALIHGFVMLELAQQLRRDNNVEHAFKFSIEAYLRGLTT